MLPIGGVMKSQKRIAIACLLSICLLSGSMFVVMALLTMGLRLSLTESLSGLLGPLAVMPIVVYSQVLMFRNQLPGASRLSPWKILSAHRFVRALLVCVVLLLIVIVLSGITSFSKSQPLVLSVTLGALWFVIIQVLSLGSLNIPAVFPIRLTSAADEAVGMDESLTFPRLLRLVSRSLVPLWLGIMILFGAGFISLYLDDLGYLVLSTIPCAFLLIFGYRSLGSVLKELEVLSPVGQDPRDPDGLTLDAASKSR